MAPKGKSLSFSITLGPKWLVDRYKRLAATFTAQFMVVHRTAVMVICGDIVKNCRVDTGRFWNAWTPFLDVAGYDYRRFAPVALNQDATAEMQGKLLGRYVDQPFFTRLENGVEYAAPLEEGVGCLTTGTLQARIPYHERYYRRYFELAAARMVEAVEKGVPVPLPAGIPDL